MATVNIGRVESIRNAQRGASPGNSNLVTTTAAGGVNRETEMYHPPGVVSGPTQNDIAVLVPIGNGGHRVVIGFENYDLVVAVDEGQTRIFSTDPGGTEIKAEIKLQTDGTIEMNGNSKSFVTHAELDTALQSFITALNSHVHTSAPSGSPTTPPVAPMSIDISLAETTTIKTGG